MARLIGEPGQNSSHQPWSSYNNDPVLNKSTRPALTKALHQLLQWVVVHKSPRRLVISLIFADDTKHSFSIFEMVNFVDFYYILSNFEMYLGGKGGASSK